MLLSKFMQVSSLPRHVPIIFLTQITNRNNSTWSFTRAIEQRIFKALLLDNNAMVQCARDAAGGTTSLYAICNYYQPFIKVSHLHVYLGIRTSFMRCHSVAIVNVIFAGVLVTELF